jgi:hypothetical protein
MDVIPTRQPLTDVSTDEPRRTPPKCCPFCLAETLLTSWDNAARCTRYECCGCFEVFGRLTRDEAEPKMSRGEVVDFGSHRTGTARTRG